MKLPIPSGLIKLSSLVPQSIYVVGGYVRNHFAGLGDTDIDIAGQGLLLLPSTYRVNTINFRLGTVLVKNKEAEYEYTPFRKETYSGGKHTPDSVNFNADLLDDSMRRDFTCNSIYYDVKKDEIIDPHHGISDIENKIVRAVSLEKTFDSDGLRLLRLVRIAAETGFKIESQTAIVAQSKAALLLDISPERKRDELNRMLVSDTKYGVKNAHYRALKLLHKLGFLRYIIPELLECDQVSQNPKYHKYDVLEHIFQTVRFADPSVRLAALFHDIGKPCTAARYGNMHGHEIASEFIAKKAMGEYGLKYSNDEIDEVSALCRNHMYDMMGNTSEAKLRLFIVKNRNIIDKLVMLIDADILGSGALEFKDEPHRFTKLKEKMITDGTPFELSDLMIGGGALISLGYEGADIGETLKELHEMCIINPKLNNTSWLMERAEAKLKKIKNAQKKK